MIYSKTQKIEKCFYPNCLHLPTHRCSCNKSAFICMFHLQSHNLQRGVHSLEKISEEIMTQSMNTSLIHSLKQRLSELRSSILKDSSSLIHFITNIFASRLNLLNDFEQKINALSLEIQKNQHSHLDTETLNMLNFELQASNLDVSSLFHSISDYFSEKYSIDQSLFYIESKNLRKFEPSTNKFSNVLSISDVNANFSPIVSVGIDKIISYGGINNDKAIGIAILYNKFSKNFKYLKPGRPRAYASLTYYKENIYAFGGWCNEALQDCQILCLDNTWKNGPNLPEASSCCSSHAYKGIWVSGFHMVNLYWLDVDHSNYVPYIGVTSESFKAIFTSKQQLIVINKQNVYILSESGWTSKKLQGELSGYVISEFVAIGDCVYFKVAGEATIKRFSVSQCKIQSMN